MRTISKNLKRRLLAQSEEANFRGLEKVAIKLNTQVNNTPLRQDFDEYIYSRNDLNNDVEDLLWKAAIRVQDYFGKTAEASMIGDMIDVMATDLISSIRLKIGGDVIGKYEPIVPGERRLTVEIDEDD